MRLLRGLLGALLWIVAALLGLVGLVMCVTLILLPLGIPILGLSRRLITRAVQLMLPHSLAHPVKESKKKRKEAGSAVSDLGDTAKDKGEGLGSLVSDSTNKAKKKIRKKTTKRTLTGRKRKSLL